MMRLNRRGQIFSLDLFIALVVVILAIGLLLQQFETLTYRQNNALAQNRLHNVAELAAQQLTTQEGIVCSVKSNSGNVLLSALPNCWPAIAPDVTKLDVPTDLDYCVVLTEGSTSNEVKSCTNATSAPNVVAVNRSIIQLSNGTSMTKQSWLACLTGGSCNAYGATKTLTVKVWKK